MNQEKYLERIGVEPSEAGNTDLEALESLQSAHVKNVPWETLSITGDPYSEREGEGVSLETDDLYEKIVENGRGGFCYELNGLFNELLTDLGFEANKLEARVITNNGDLGPPANHLTNRVSLDEDYIVDVGMGEPTMRRPVAFDGEENEDNVGVEWRVIESDRVDADYTSQYRNPGDDEWTSRYVFKENPRSLEYFEATCEFLQSAPESPFTGNTIVALATEDGHKVLRPDKLTYEGGRSYERPIDRENWSQTLEEEFGITYGSI